MPTQQALENRARHEAWKVEQFKSQKTVFYGASVDLSPAAVQDVLSGVEARGVGDRVSVRFRGQWWTLSRTDLLDDVCTGHIISGSAAEIVDFYREKAVFGARLKTYAHGRFFAVVDSHTDG